jgi:hypothetical protein
MTMMRYTVTEPGGTTSFVGPCHALKMLVAACARNPRNLSELLELLAKYDAAFATAVRDGLAVFDEHNVRGNTRAIERAFAEQQPSDWPPFRVLSEPTHRASTQPAQAGLIIFNLGAKRIIQVQNSYAEIQRKDRGRLRAAGKPLRQLYYYDLPPAWSLTP